MKGRSRGGLGSQQSLAGRERSMEAGKKQSRKDSCQLKFLTTPGVNFYQPLSLPWIRVENSTHWSLIKLSENDVAQLNVDDWLLEVVVAVVGVVLIAVVVIMLLLQVLNIYSRIYKYPLERIMKLSFYLNKHTFILYAFLTFPIGIYNSLYFR